MLRYSCHAKALVVLFLIFRIAVNVYFCKVIFNFFIYLKRKHDFHHGYAIDEVVILRTGSHKCDIF
ncbi:hypothetical protein PRIPAC_88603 [Pristionchus pacificus]|uniref:Uncharacterized protein n=1 Tax=Pristionchus pacificus TaxID=54126 RepID=A0A2A6B6Y0_PRIPA|nr:hypothetical protein PRIPAC_88603 [Pristionchus pacificus]|eukprot:PDM61626.1 hypothetical protein PRIPAC_51068 [Pristionchus pacificus]